MFYDIVFGLQVTAIIIYVTALVMMLKEIFNKKRDVHEKTIDKK